MSQINTKSRLLFVGILVSLALVPAVDAASNDIKEIMLNDGSRIRGVVESMENGLYQVNTESLGRIQLGSGQIESIRSIEAVIAPMVSPDASAVTQSTIDSIQSRITNNASVMRTIMDLQNDPEMKAVLADPEVMRAVQSFDLDALAANPKIKALMNNQKIRSIQGSVN